VRLSTKGRADLADLRAYAGALQASFVAYIVGMTFLNGQYAEMLWHFVGLTVALDRVCTAALGEARAPAAACPPPHLVPASAMASNWRPA
jgi:hypothetical protein